MKPVFYGVCIVSLLLGFSFIWYRRLSQPIEQAKKGDPPS